MRNLVLSSARMHYFDEVAKHQSVRKASESLNVSASAINRQILLLEEELGIALFERLPRGMKLTDAGRIVLDTIRRFEQDCTAAISEIDALRSLRRGHVSLGTLLYLSEKFVPSIILEMRRDYPDISFSVFFGNSSEIVSRILDGRLDIGLCWAPAPSMPIANYKRASVPLGVAALPDHPIARQTKLRLRDLIGYPLIFPDKGTDYRVILDQIDLGAQRSISPAVETTSMSMMRRLVLSGVGLALVSRPVIIEDILSGTIIMRRLNDPGVRSLTLGLFTRAERNLPVAVQLMLRRLAPAFDRLTQKERPA